MSSLCRSRIDSLTRVHLGPWAKAVGFRKKDTKWNRREGDFIDVVELQVSRWNDDVICNATVNLGVFVTSVYERCWGPSPAFIAETDCTVRTRLSALLQSDASYLALVDDWWDVTSPSEAGDSITAALDGAALRYFDRLHDLSAIHDELELATGNAAVQPATLLYSALVKSDIGDIEGAERVMTRFEDPKLRAWRERAATVRQHLSG